MNFMRFNKAKSGVLHLGWGKPQYQYRLRNEGIESSPTEKNFEVLVDEKIGHDLEMCACSPEGQLCPALHQKQCGKQVEGGDSAPLLHSSETSPGVLCSALDPQHRKHMELLEWVQRRASK